MIGIADTKLAVIGLGYVGLPLAVEFGKKMDVLGFDINQHRVDELKSGRDGTLEVSEAELAESTRLSFSANVDAYYLWADEEEAYKEHVINLIAQPQSGNLYLW